MPPVRRCARRALVVAATVAPLALGGCAGEAEPAESAAERFYAAVAASDWAGACGLLAPVTRSELEQSAGTACAEALAAEGLADPGAVLESSRYGTMAQARFSRDTVFLTRFGPRWRVLAAGCAPVPGRPYDCRLEGG